MIFLLEIPHNKNKKNFSPDSILEYIKNYDTIEERGK